MWDSEGDGWLHISIYVYILWFCRWGVSFRADVGRKWRGRDLARLGRCVGSRLGQFVGWVFNRGICSRECWGRPMWGQLHFKGDRRCHGR